MLPYSENTWASKINIKPLNVSVKRPSHRFISIYQVYCEFILTVCDVNIKSVDASSTNKDFICMYLSWNKMFVEVDGILVV